MWVKYNFLNEDNPLPEMYSSREVEVVPPVGSWLAWSDFDGVNILGYYMVVGQRHLTKWVGFNPHDMVVLNLLKVEEIPEPW